MKMKLAVAALVLFAGAAGYGVSTMQQQAQAQEKPAIIDNLDAHLAADEAYKTGDLTKRAEILAQLLKERRIDSNRARGVATRELLAHARANDMDPHTKLVPFVQWLGGISKDYKNPLNVALRNTGAVDALIEVHGAERLWKDEAFLKADSGAKLARIKELWDARELDQSQAYDLTRHYAYDYLRPAEGNIDKQLEMFGKLQRSTSIDWAGIAGVHHALLTRALHEKADLDTTEKKLTFIQKVTKNKEGDLSWMVAGNRSITLFMHAVDAEFSKLDGAARKAKLDEYEKQGLITKNEAGILGGIYSAGK